MNTNQTAAGIAGERSGLWREMARIVGEVRPRYVLVENSPLHGLPARAVAGRPHHRETAGERRVSGTKYFMPTQDPESKTAPAVDLHRVVRRWWVIECMEGSTMYETGGAHETLEKAEWYVRHCLMPKRRAKKARIVRHEEHAWMEAPNDEALRRAGETV